MYEERIQLFSNMQDFKKKKSLPTSPLDSCLKIQVFYYGKINKRTKNEDPEQKWMEPRKVWRESIPSSKGSHEVSLCKIWEYMKTKKWSKGGGEMALENIQSEKTQILYKGQCIIYDLVLQWTILCN